MVNWFYDKQVFDKDMKLGIYGGGLYLMLFYVSLVNQIKPTETVRTHHIQSISRIRENLHPGS